VNKDETILDAIKRLGNGASFVELEREIPEIAGEHCILVAENCFIWTMEKEWMESFLCLFNAGMFFCKPTSPLVYFCDGMPGWIMQYPMAKKARAYKNLRWLPSCIYASKT